MKEAPKTPTTASGASKETQFQSVEHGKVQAKRFATLQAQFALLGHALHEVPAKSGESSYFAEKWGLVRWLDDIDAAEAFFLQIGG